MPSYRYINIDPQRRRCTCNDVGRWMTVLMVLLSAGIVLLVGIEIFKNTRRVNYNEYNCISTTSSTEYKSGYGSFEHNRFKLISYGAASLCDINNVVTQTTIWFPIDNSYHVPFNQTFTGKFNDGDILNGMFDNDIYPARTFAAVTMLLMGIIIALCLIYYAYDPVWKYYTRYDTILIDNNGSDSTNERNIDTTINSSYNIIYLVVLMMLYGILWTHCG